MATYSPNGINNNTGTALGFGNNANNLMSVNGPSNPADSVSYVITNTATGVVPNYFRTSDILTLDGVMENLNTVAGSFYATANESVPEYHSSQLARKLDVSGIDIYGNITYGPMNGSGYYLAVDTGNIFDRPADAQADPYGTPPNFQSLVGLTPVTHTFSSLTSF
jgi:hypothetical protein